VTAFSVVSEKKVPDAIATKTVLIRCGKCGKKHFEITGWLSFRYLFRCSRCGWWNTPEGATAEKPLTGARSKGNAQD